MSTPIIELEFVRSRNAEASREVRLGEQEYLRRLPRGVYASATFNWTRERLDQLYRLYRNELTPEEVRALGREIRAFLDDVEWDADEARILEVSGAGARARLLITSMAQELYALPLELMTLERAGQPIGLLPGVVLRYRWPGVTAATRSSGARGRALLVWAEPAHDPVPHAEHVAALMDAELPWLAPFDPARDVLANVSLDRLAATLDEAEARDEPVRLLHVLCHGVRAGGGIGLGLARDDGEGQSAVDVAEFTRRMYRHRESLELVVLSVCSSADPGAMGSQLGGLALELHCVGIPAVIGSRFPLSKLGSIAMTRALYRGLRGGLERLDDAVELARQALESDERPFEWATLQLFSAAPERGREDEDEDEVAPAPAVNYEGPDARPAARDPFFLGRDEALAELERALAEPGSSCVAVIGPAGVGKTALVRQFVAGEAARRQFPGGARWLDGRALDDELRRATRASSDRSLAPGTAAARLREQLARAERPGLLVIDGLRAPVDPERLPLPEGRGKAILISRSVDLRYALPVTPRAVTLTGWPREAARAYLREHAPRLRATADASIDALIDYVGGLPRALRPLAEQSRRGSLTPRPPSSAWRPRPTGARRTSFGVRAVVQASVDDHAASIAALESLAVCPGPRPRPASPSSRRSRPAARRSSSCYRACPSSCTGSRRPARGRCAPSCAASSARAPASTSAPRVNGRGS
ncbi:MAG: CHAT domain-containing protein [Myxococcales bacterium]|nr:CHAT domain-containing protein [Myxococcales bacterium]